MSTNNNGGARWHLMDLGVCSRCGLRHRVGIAQASGERSQDCRNREKCDARAAKKLAKKLKQRESAEKGSDDDWALCDWSLWFRGGRFD